MSKRLPSLNALRVFETAARQQNYSRAAEELFLTHGAVSHQIRALEDDLGVKLLRRSGRAMLLTDEGRRLYAHVHEGLAQLRKGVEALRSDQRRQTLTVSVTPSLAASWLVPRLPDFYRHQPHIEVYLRATQALTDFRREEVDIAVRYGPGQWPGLSAEKLLHEDVFPVCSPRYRDGGLPTDAAALLDCVLLHDIFSSWDEWFKSMGVTPDAPLHGPGFSDPILAIQAAADRQGVALARSALVQKELEDGRLVRPLRSYADRRAPFAYYIVYPTTAELPARVRAFRDWLLRQADAPTGEVSTPRSTNPSLV